MFEKLCPLDDMVEIDIAGYLDAANDPSCETTNYDLDGKEVS